MALVLNLSLVIVPVLVLVLEIFLHLLLLPLLLLITCLSLSKSVLQESTEPKLLHIRSEASDPFSFLLQLPDDILLVLLGYLPLEDLIRYLSRSPQVFSSSYRCEQVCLVLREVVQLYGVYKVRLDTICRRKRINNYMELSQRW